MRVVFESVSATYESQKSQKRTRRRKRKHAECESDACMRWALRDITCEINHRSLVAVVGHTGSGKSTFLRCMNGLMKPACGCVRFEDETIRGIADVDARNFVGMVFQYPEQQLFAATVFDDVAFGLRNRRCDEADVRQRVHDALLRVDLDPDVFATQSPFALSGGQQRRVALAGVLSCNPHILVLDEPTSGLDPQSKEHTEHLMVKLKEEGMSIVVATHDMDFVAQAADHVLVLIEGRLALQGNPSEVFSQADILAQASLTPPRAAVLAQRLKAQGLCLPEGILSRDALIDALAAQK